MEPFIDDDNLWQERLNRWLVAKKCYDCQAASALSARDALHNFFALPLLRYKHCAAYISLMYTNGSFICVNAKRLFPNGN